MVDDGAFPGNQLLFNLYNGSAPLTMSTKFNAPKPIFIEKIPVAATPQRGFGPASAFTAISEDSMSRAMDLVRLDLKKKKLDFVSLSPTRSRSRFTTTKIVRSRTYQDKLKKRQGRHSPVLTVKERQSRKPSKTVVIQTDRPATDIIGRKYNLADLPARSMSPPTRDVPTTTHEDKVLGEICRLQREMTKCLQQMRCIREKRSLQPKGINARAPVYAEDVEEQRKRKIRSEERATRSARTIYMLMQQTNKLHEEIRKLDTAMKIETKKGQLTSRLAALHRGVVRALQLLVQQMSDGGDDHQSVSRDYRDLAIIIRQLSISCAQLEVTNESSVAQEDLLNLLNDVAELNEIVERVDPPSSPLRPCRSAFEGVERKKSELSLRTESSTSVYRNPIEKVRVTLDDFGQNMNKGFLPNAKEFKTESGNREQRRAVVSNGLQRLLKSNNVYITVPGLGVQRPKKKLKVCCHAKNRSRKGVLLTHQNKGSSCGCGHWNPNDDYQHYARPTVSTVQKRPVVRRSRGNSPARAATPCSSAIDTSWHFAEPTFSKTQKEVSVSQDRSRSSSCSTSPQLTPRRVRSSQSSVSQDTAWRRNMEMDVRTRIEPLLQSGQIAADVNKVTDEIIGDLMVDMANELHGRREENRATYQAAVLRDASDVETILQRLHQMEMEQDEIRLRWTSLAYGDLKPTGVTLTDAPDSPIPVEIIAGVRGAQVTTRQQMQQIPDSSEPIIFTKPRHKATLRETDFQIDKSVRDSGIVVSLQPEALYNIRLQVQNFESYLKRQVNERVDLFDPWKVVENIADDIVENCLLDICSELEDINSDIVNHVYRSEFALDPARERQP